MRLFSWIAKLLGWDDPLPDDAARETTLYLTRLEDRQVLDASFGVAGAAGQSLNLTQFDGTTTNVNVAATTTGYQFTLNSGVWNGANAPGVTGSGGSTLVVDTSTISGTINLNDSAAGSDVNVQFVNSATNPSNAQLVLSAVGKVTLNGDPRCASLEINAAQITINSSTITTTGSQTYNAPVTLSASATLQSTGGGDIRLLSTADGPGGLTIDTTGNVTMGPAGVTSRTLGELSVRHAVQVDLDTVQVDGGINVAGATINLHGTFYGTRENSGLDMTFDGPVHVLATSAVTEVRSGIGRDVHFKGTIDGRGALLVAPTAGTGNVALDGAAGATTPLASLVIGANGVNIGANQVDVADIHTTGNIGLHGTTNNLHGTTYRSDSGGFDVGAAFVKAAGPITVSSGGNGQIIFNALNGAQALIINTGGTTYLQQPIGNVTPLLSLTTGASGTTFINGNVTTTGSQTYGDQVLLIFGGDVTLKSTSGGDIDLNSTVDGKYGLSIDTTGNVKVGAAGIAQQLTFFRVLNAAQVDLDNVQVSFGELTVTGSAINLHGTFYGSFEGAGRDVTFDGPVHVLATSAVTEVRSALGRDVHFRGAVDGPGGLFLIATGLTGNVLMDAPAGTFTPLGSLTTLANVVDVADLHATGKIELGATSIILRGQNYETVTGSFDLDTDARLLGSTRFSSSGGPIRLQRVNGGPNHPDLTITTSNLVALTGVGDSEPLGSLDITGSQIRLSGVVTTLGNQTYHGAVALSDSILNSTNPYSSDLLWP